MTKTTTKAKTASADKPVAAVKTVPNPPQALTEAEPIATENVAMADIPDAEVTQLASVNYAQALLLPEVPADIETLPISLSIDSVQAFKSADRRTLRVVRTADGLAAQAAAD